LLRSGLYKAAAARGQDGLKHADLAPAVFDALRLDFREYAADPDVMGLAKASTQDALKRVIQYHLYRALQRLWRVTAPNLEDCGLLRFEYAGLPGSEGLLEEVDLWSSGFTVRPDKKTELFVETPIPLRQCPPELRAEVTTTLLDVLRRNIAVKVD